MLEFKNVSIKIAEGKESTPFSLIINEGEVVNVHGGSGTGKSLILLSILGLHPIATGFITLDGELITTGSAPYFRKMMAYVPQNMPKDEISVKSLCSMLLGDKTIDSELSTRSLDELSQEDLQSVMLSIALKMEHKIVLVDDLRPTETNIDLVKQIIAKGAEVILTSRDEITGCYKVVEL